MVIKAVPVADRLIGPGHQCFIIAEAGVNHNGDLDCAKRLVDAAAEAGADAVKFQTFSADTLVTRAAQKARYQIETTGGEESQFDMLRRLELSPEAHRQIASYCDDREILFLSSAFDESSVDLLVSLGVPAFKIPSGEITNTDLLGYIARFGKPLLVSTGMCCLAEVEAALQTVEQAGDPGTVLFHCVSEYPAHPGGVNLLAMHTLATAFGVPVGYSDHTLGTEVALGAAALGACVIEKHLTLNRAAPGPDHRASLEPKQFADMVRGIRMIEAALGSGRKRPTPGEIDTAAVARKSLVAARDIPSGAVVTDAMLALRRPGTGLAPALRAHLIGRTTRRAVEAGELIALDMIG